MEVSRIIAEIDAQILKLQQARALLSTSGSTPEVAAKPTKRRGRPKGSKNATTVAPAAPAKKAKRQLTPEGRKAIADAMKRRWAERKKAAAKTPSK